MVFIYVLELENNKYYVGKTLNPYFRLENHFNNNGSQWTKLYKPIKLLELIPNCDDYDEDKYTKIYMDKYGIDNVRGGAYTTIKLNNTIKKHLIKISNSINNRCFRCGKEGHFANKCHFNDNDNDNDFINDDTEDEIENETESDEYDSDDSYDSDDEYESDCSYNSNDSDDEEDVVWCCEYCDKEFKDKYKCEYHEKNCKKRN